MSACCDVGLIFLDPCFTIPNFPSRLLAYMQAGLPVLACTDTNTDIGKIIIEGGFGVWCESNDENLFLNMIEQMNGDNVEKYRNQSRKYLLDVYNVPKVFSLCFEIG